VWAVVVGLLAVVVVIGLFLSGVRRRAWVVG
jgi:hypothetical protein